MMGTQTIRITDEAVAILDSYGTKALEARESRNPRTKAKKASYTNLVYAMEKEVRDLRAGLTVYSVVYGNGDGDVRYLPSPFKLAIILLTPQLLDPSSLRNESIRSDFSNSAFS